MKSRKKIVTEFENLLITGKIKEAYEKYVDPDFCHHNPFFPGDRQSLLTGMEENATQFAHKDYEIKRVLEDGDFVVTHAKLKLEPKMPEISVVHIYRFSDDKIVEEWDLTQSLPEKSPNQNGLF